MWRNGVFFGNKSGVNLKQIFRSLAREGKSQTNCSLAGSRILYTVEKKITKKVSIWKEFVFLLSELFDIKPTKCIEKYVRIY